MITRAARFRIMHQILFFWCICASLDYFWWFKILFLLLFIRHSTHPIDFKSCIKYWLVMWTCPVVFVFCLCLLKTLEFSSPIFLPLGIAGILSYGTLWPIVWSCPWGINTLQIWSMRRVAWSCFILPQPGLITSWNSLVSEGIQWPYEEPFRPWCRRICTPYQFAVRIHIDGSSGGCDL